MVPAWNEEFRIPRTLEEYLGGLERSGRPFEVIVVVDGARDGTARVSARYAQRGVRVLETPRRLGKGGAVIWGFREAAYNLIGFVDADAPVSTEDIELMIAELGRSDCAIGSRRAKGSVVETAPPLSRRIASAMWSLLVRAIMHLPVTDTQCGAKFFRRKLLLSALDEVRLTDWAFDVSLLYHIFKQGGKITEVPIHWRHSDNGHFSIQKFGPQMIATLLGLRLLNSPLRNRIPAKIISWYLTEFGQANSSG